MRAEPQIITPRILKQKFGRVHDGHPCQNMYYIRNNLLCSLLKKKSWHIRFPPWQRGLEKISKHFEKIIWSTFHAIQNSSSFSYWKIGLPILRNSKHFFKNGTRRRKIKDFQHVRKYSVICIQDMNSKRREL